MDVHSTGRKGNRQIKTENQRTIRLEKQPIESLKKRRIITSL